MNNTILSEDIKNLGHFNNKRSKNLYIVSHDLIEQQMLNLIYSLSFIKFSLDFTKMFSQALFPNFVYKPDIFTVLDLIN